MSTLNARFVALDPAESVALVVRAKRGPLLRAHAYKLRREDLEDCYSQAALELVVRAKAGVRFASRTHIAHTLEQRFVSRITDRRRAIEGRSEAQWTFERALGASAFVGEQDVCDPQANVERLALLRCELRQVSGLAAELSEDQRLVLACQVALQMTCAEFCARFGWSEEKFRKVTQRARRRLRRLIDERDTQADVA